MALFDTIISEVASRYNVTAATVKSLVNDLIGLMTNEGNGGITAFAHQFRHAGFGDAFDSWLGGGKAQVLSASQLEGVLGHDTISRMASHAGIPAQDVGSISGFVLPKIVSFLTPGGSLPSNAGAVAMLESFLRPSDIRPSVVTEVRRGPSLLPWVIGLLILLGIAWYLSTRGPSPTIDSRLSFTNDDGKIAFSGLVGDEASRDAIVAALHGAFGASNMSGDIRVDPQVKRVAWLPRLADITSALKTPGAEVFFEGESVRLGGWLSDATRADLQGRLEGSLGPGVTFSALTDKATETAQAANQRAISALDALGSQHSPQQVIDVLNLAVVNFSSGSAEIPSDARRLILTGAQALKAAAADTRIEIGGHTDNTGDKAANLKLSEERAAAIRDAFVAEGVNASIFTVKGYGDAEPVSSNQTEHGRFQNRRIAYKLLS